MFNCSCCGTDVTSPYFFNGGVYGWTCIKKVNSNAKKNKPKTKCVEVEILKIKWRTPDSNLDGCGDAVVSINGVKQIVGARKDLHESSEFYLDTYSVGNFEFHDGKWWAFV